MSVLRSHFIPVYPSPSPCPQVHSLHQHLYSCPAPRFFRTFFFFRFHIYVLAYGICFSLFLLPSVFLSLSLFHYFSLPLNLTFSLPPLPPSQSLFLWLSSSDSHPLTLFLWLSSSDSLPLTFILWLSSYDSHPLTLFLWFSSTDSHPLTPSLPPPSPRRRRRPCWVRWTWRARRSRTCRSRTAACCSSWGRRTTPTSSWWARGSSPTRSTSCCGRRRRSWPTRCWPSRPR